MIIILLRLRSKSLTAIVENLRHLFNAIFSLIVLTLIKSFITYCDFVNGAKIGLSYHIRVHFLINLC